LTDSEASGGFVYSGEGLHEGVLGVHFLRNVAEVHGEEGFHYAGRELGGSVGGEGSGGGGGGFLVALVLLGVFGARGFLRDFLDERHGGFRRISHAIGRSRFEF